MPDSWPAARSTSSRGSNSSSTLRGRRLPGTYRSRRRARAGRSRRSPPRPRRRSFSAAAHDPQQEQVEDREKAELESDRDGLEHDRLLQLEPDHRCAELDLVPGPDDLGASIRLPFRDTPFVEPRSPEHPRAAARADLGVLAGNVRVVDHDVALAAAADASRPPGRPPSACRRRAAAPSPAGPVPAPRAALRPGRRCCRSSFVRTLAPVAAAAPAPVRAGRPGSGSRTRRDPSRSSVSNSITGLDSSASRSRRACSSRYPASSPASASS